MSMSSTKFLLAIKKLQSFMIKKITQISLDINIDINGTKCEKRHRTRHKLNIFFVNR
jgi:hypothetical protein